MVLVIGIGQERMRKIEMNVEEEIKDIKKVVSFLYGNSKLLFAKETNAIVKKWDKEIDEDE